MLKNYLIAALRNIVRQKLYSFINIIGLSVGIAACILILLWVIDELSYDKFHEKVNNLYRVTVTEEYSGGEPFYFASTPPNLGPTLKEEYSEIINTARYRNLAGRVIKINENIFFENDFVAADASLFEMFSFPIIEGSVEQALSQPDGVLISESISHKYFGNDNPIGKQIIVDNKHNIFITGVFKDIPSNSHIKFDFVIPLKSIERFGFPLDRWDYFAFTDYVELQENCSLENIKNKIKNVIKQHDESSIATISLQPITDIHLFSSKYGGKGDIKTVILFSFIAVLVLLTACINFMNLFTAQSTKKAKEIGLRKVVGSSREKIILKIYFETFVLTVFALLLSVLIVELFLPWFNNLSAKELTLNFGQNIFLVSILLGVVVITSIIAGAYPAFHLSAFNPLKIMKGEMYSGSKGSSFRKVLVTIQFTLSIILIICSFFISKQLIFMRNYDMGYDKDHVLILSLKGESKKHRQTLKSELIKLPGVKSCCAVSHPPTRPMYSFNVDNWEGRNTEDKILTYVMYTDQDFLETLNIELKEGRYLSNEIASDSIEGLVINQSAAKYMGMNNPIGKMVSDNRIIGVVNDFHFNTLHTDIKPHFFFLGKDDFNYLLIKLNSINIIDTRNLINETWLKINPDIPIESEFLDAKFDEIYRKDIRTAKIVIAFTILIILISCLGLFGLASFSAAQRTKEIGIRKVLGASIKQIVSILSWEFTKWVVLANLIAWPISFYIMKKMLNSYEYKVDLSWWIFALAGLTTFIIAVITVSFHAYRAANTNPAKTLKYE